MNKIRIILVLLLFGISNICSNEIIKELINKINKNKYYAISEEYKKLIKENKIYLMPNIYPDDVYIKINNNTLIIKIINPPISIKNYEIIKKNSKYILKGILIQDSKANNKIKLEFNFEDNFLIIIDYNDKKWPNIFYIDTNNDFKERYVKQRKDYFHTLIKDSNNNELIVTQEGKIIYNNSVYDYQLETLYKNDLKNFYMDKFILRFGEYIIPVEIINKTLKIIREKKIQKTGPFYSIE